MSRGIMFHHFHQPGEPRIQGSLTGDEFERMLVSVLQRNEVLGPSAWVSASMSGTLSPESVCITFDDALQAQIDIALPVLDKLGIKAFFFVYSSVFNGVAEPLELQRFFRNLCFRTIEAFYAAFYEAALESGYGESVELAQTSDEAGRYLSDHAFYTEDDRRFRFFRDLRVSKSEYDALITGMMNRSGFDADALAKIIWMDNTQLRSLSDAGHMIGLHSYSHPTNLGLLDPATQAEEYRMNREHLVAVTGLEPITMAHPSNSYNEDTLKLLTEMGVKVGFRSNDALKVYSPLEQPRIDHTGLTPAL